MNIESSGVVPVLIILNTVWLIVISGIVYFTFRKNRVVSKGLKDGTLLAALERILEKESANAIEIANVKREIAKIEAESKHFIQRVGLVRYNPFNETGGDQSFSLCLLNEQESGFIVTCLHTRDRSRVYAKPIAKGKSGYELSKEELQAISLANKQK